MRMRFVTLSTLSVIRSVSLARPIGYTSTGAKDGRFHAIRVELKNGSYRVRARRGYFAN